jgi:hypothetical protein
MKDRSATTNCYRLIYKGGHTHSDFYLHLSARTRSVKSKGYSNRTKKDDTYETLIHEMKEVDENAGRSAVVHKINNIRTTF